VQSRPWPDHWRDVRRPVYQVRPCRCTPGRGRPGRGAGRFDPRARPLPSAHSAGWRERHPAACDPFQSQSMTRTGPTRDDARAHFGERQFRDALAEFATGVTIIATATRRIRACPATSGSPPTRSTRFRWTRRWSVGACRATRTRCPRSSSASVMRSPCSRSTRPRSPDASPARMRTASRRAFRLGWADAPLIDGAWPGSSAGTSHATHRRSHAVRREVVHCARAQGPGLVFHHGRFGTIAPTGA